LASQNRTWPIGGAVTPATRIDAPPAADAVEPAAATIAAVNMIRSDAETFMDPVSP
jgi:hypothetical protein